MRPSLAKHFIYIYTLLSQQAHLIGIIILIFYAFLNLGLSGSKSNILSINRTIPYCSQGDIRNMVA